MNNYIGIRDNRDKHWFWLDSEYLNGYAKHLGVNCTVVYISLCRHANNDTQKCFPSMELIGEENKIHRTTVLKAIKKLEEWGLIKIEKRKSLNGKQVNNIYTLTSKKLWKPKPEEVRVVKNNTEEPCQFQNKTVSVSEQNRVAKIDSNYTKLTTLNNKTQSDSKIIFEYWNNSNIIHHSKLTEKTTRKIKSILKDYSLEEVKEAIKKYSIVLNGENYWWKYKWTLEEFLQRGFEKFKDSPLENFEGKENISNKYIPLSEKYKG